MSRLLLLAVLSLAAAPAAAQERRLTVGEAWGDSLAAADTHRFALDLGARQFVYGEAVQHTVDVVVTVYAPDGRVVAAVDMPSRGPEPFQFETAAPGRYRVEIVPFQQATGRYTLAVTRAEPVATTPEGRVDQLMAAYGAATPGAALLVVRGGEVLLARGYGLADVEHAVPITPETVFDVASVSKQFTGMAVAMLAEQGALDLDADVRTYLPDQPDYGAPVTIRQLVHHTAGVRDWPNAFALAGLRFEDVITFDDILALARRQRELNFAPGSAFLYSNTGYNLLARVVEVVTGQPFDAWTHAHLFAPLGMTRSHFLRDHAAVVPGRAHSYQPGPEGRYQNVGNHLSAVGSSSLFTTLSDLAKWVVNFGRQEVGGAAVHARMRERGVLSTGDTTAYAFGLSAGTHRGLQRLSHSGSWAGFRTFLAYYPALDAGVVVLANVATFDAGGTAAALAEAYFGDALAPAVPAPAAASAAPPPPEPWQPSAADLAAFAGRYESPELEAAYTLAVAGERLVARHPRHGEIVLAPKAPDAFTGNAWFFGEVRFERDAAGHVAAMRVSNGRVLHLRFERR